MTDALQQMPRRSLLWLTIALFVAVGPHLLRQPGWLPLVFAFSAAWRYQVWSGRWGLPAWPLKMVLVAMSVSGVLLAYGSLVGVDPAMALLVIGCALKLIEFARHRDFIVLAYLAYFIAACHFIYEQGIPAALYVLLALTLISAALISRHQSTRRQPLVNPLGLAAKMLLQSLPVMVLLFVVFPRIGPLWSIPQPDNHARTGPSDNMSPGDVARLSRSAELAFRVTFDGPLPVQRDLYWRGLIFSEFDGRVWKRDRSARYESQLAAQGARQVSFAERSLQTSARRISYEVILEPTWQNWAFGLDVPIDVDPQLRWGSDFSLITRNAVAQRIRYRMVSDPDAHIGAALRPSVRQQNLSLPEGYNPRTRELASTWRAEADNDRALIDRVLTWFNREAFVYTLSPPLLGRDTVDEFLFDTRRGFCEHYAGSFVVLLRAAGIPARVVTGYQGGEHHATGDYLLVHQYDAHAWAEAWLDGQGWVRLDPTAAVAPERVERSLQDYLGRDFLADTPLSLARYRDVPLLYWLRMRWDMVGYYWANLVLGYNDRVQFAVLSKLLGEVTPQRLVALLLACGGVVLLVLAVALLRGRARRPLDPATRLYLRFCRRMAGLGIRRAPGEGPRDFAVRIARERPELAEGASAITARYLATAFAGEEQIDELRRSVYRFRLGRSA